MVKIHNFIRPEKPKAVKDSDRNDDLPGRAATDKSLLFRAVERRLFQVKGNKSSAEGATVPTRVETMEANHGVENDVVPDNCIKDEAMV